MSKSQENSQTVIHLEDVSVRYRIPSEPIRTFKEYLIRLVQGRIRHNDFWALKEINIDVKKGEVFGIIGRNGAGKSTLLKVISKVLIPFKGHVWIKGNISPLLQLGAGFHPELTGRENIFLNGTLLGHSQQEIEAKFDEIIAFADIGDFLETPLRTYSSGMQSRLGFSVATAWQPDILILDEVLAVGDFAFRNKCINRLKKYKERGMTILMVSHESNQIKHFCKRVMLLDHGEVHRLGPSAEVCDYYEEFATNSSGNS